MGFLENTLAFVFVLGVLVLIHELGHHLAARYFGIRVESFSIGFGPRLFGFRYGETDYKVCLLPLGGYVKMAGVELVGDSVGEQTATVDPDGFLAKPRWQRLVVLFMGPLFNVLLAIALMTGLYMLHFERPEFLAESAEVGYVVLNSGAARAGIERGDRIVSIDGEATPQWQAVRMAEIANVNSTVVVEVERDGAIIELPVAIGADDDGLGVAGWAVESLVRLGDAGKGTPAAAADIRNGDLVVAINRQPILAVEQVVDRIRALGGTEIELTLDRDGDRLTTLITPVYDEKTDVDDPAWRIGVGLGAIHETVVSELGFGAALGQSIADNRTSATLIVRILKGLVAQRVPASTLTGPVGIAKMSGEAARRSWQELVALMAGISLNLGIFNLLPIPVLDGGSILLLLFESVIRRDVSLVVKERILQVGLAFIVLLFAFVMYSDISKSLGSG